MENNNNQFNQNQQNIPVYNVGSTEPPEHGKAVASLVLGIIGLCCCGICSIIGLVMAVKAKNAGNDESIRTAGFVLGIIGVVLWAIGIIVSFATGIISELTYSI